MFNIAKLPRRRLALLLTLLFLLASLPAQAGIFSISPLQGPVCATTFPIQFRGSNVVAGAYGAWVTDVNGSVVGASSVTVDPGHLFVNALFDLTSLTPGPATVSIIDPSFFTSSFVFNIGTCPSGSGVEVRLYGVSTISPVRTWQFVASVINFGSSPTALPVNVQVDGIPTTAEIQMNPPTGATAAISPPPPVGQQGFTVTVPAGLAGGASADFVFDLTALAPAVGFTYPLGAHFTSVYSGSDSLPLSVIASKDPNTKSGPPGLGTPRYVEVTAPLVYNVTFENEDTATAPAQKVVVADQLDPSQIDLNSFLFGPITFGSKLVTPPFGVASFSVTVPYTVEANALLVKIDGEIDLDILSPTYGQASWTFQSLDPNTGLAPVDPSVGFLPPDLTPPEGQGAVAFTVSPLPTLSTGDVVPNSASVVFDLNAPIRTTTWSNTILNQRPTLTIQQVTGQVKLAWGGWILQEATDPAGGWLDTAVQVSPWTFTPPGTQKFYRLRIP